VSWVIWVGSLDQFMDDLLHEVRERLLVPISPVKED